MSTQSITTRMPGICAENKTVAHKYRLDWTQVMKRGSTAQNNRLLVGEITLLWDKTAHLLLIFTLSLVRCAFQLCLRGFMNALTEVPYSLCKFIIYFFFIIFIPVKWLELIVWSMNSVQIASAGSRIFSQVIIISRKIATFLLFFC